MRKTSFIGNPSPADISPLFESVLSSLPDREFTFLPGFCDVHVHFREPGFSYKETIRSGSLSAAHGGYTNVAAMPNLVPVPDSVPAMEEQLRLIRRDAVICVHPYAAITCGQRGETLSDFEGLAPLCFAFSDDGKGVQDRALMKEAMLSAKARGKLIAAHCEVNSLLHGGCIHDGAFAQAHGLPGICPESEWRMIERDLDLAKETGCAYHVCHISCRESVRLIRQAKAAGVDVSCETGPHYLVLDESFLQDEGRFKMNPPLRSKEDREALLEGLADGTIDMIATDHAPHSAEEKSKKLLHSAFGVVGLETAFPVLYTHLVKKGIIAIEKLVALMADNPRKRFGLPATDDFSLWDLNESYAIDPAAFLSMGRATPFEGMTVYGRNYATVYDKKIVYQFSPEV